MAGNAIRMAKAIKPMSRSDGEQLMKQFMQRVEEVNARDELTHIVQEAHVFGSYLNPDAKDLGDLDLAVKLRFRDIPGRDVMKYSEERANQSGRTFRNHLEFLFYGETEARRILKGGSRYISMHSVEDLAQAGGRSRLLYPPPKT
jgi:predicted nucleotidyltransferase